MSRVAVATGADFFPWLRSLPFGDANRWQRAAFALDLIAFVRGAAALEATRAVEDARATPNRNFCGKVDMNR
jgi:hypothetical protein